MKSKLVLVALLIIGIMSSSKQLKSEQVFSSNRPYDAVIVGGGIAGMTAAFYLKDYHIVVLEKQERVGGRAFSEEYKGFFYARGTEYLGQPEDALKEIIKSLNLTPREIPYPADIHYDNGTYYYGEMGKALYLIKMSDLKTYNRFVNTILETYEDYEDIPELSLNSELMELDEITARQWFERNRFPKVYQDTYNVTFKGLFGATIDEISALSALTEIAFDFEGEEKIGDLDDLENIGTPGKYKTGMFSFDKGIAEIPLAIASIMKEKVQLRSLVTKVEKSGKLYRVFYQTQDGATAEVLARSVILATPAPVSLKIGDEVLSKEQKSILDQVSYASYLTVALFSSDKIFNRGFDLAMPDGNLFTDIYDATWIQRYYNPKLKERNTWVTTLYIAPKSYKDHSILMQPEDELMTRLYDELDKLFPGARSKVEKYEVTRFLYAYPVMTKGAYRRLTRLHQISGKGIFLAGDYMIYPTFEAAAESGSIAADKLEGWLGL
ncbi:FAD-dependent oxidoreductase [bacterium]|nr:FAD-dependent oxidoreductase [bacterium]